MKIIRKHIPILKMLLIASPFYIAMSLLNELLLFANFFVGLVFIRYITNYIVYHYSNLNFIRIVIFFGVFYLFVFIIELSTFSITRFFIFFEKDKISKYIQREVYEKVSKIDLCNYDNTEFYDKYNRAVYDAHERLFNTGDYLSTVFRSLLYIISFCVLFIIQDVLFIIAALFIAVHNVILVFIRNKMIVKNEYIKTPVIRRSQFVEYTLSAYKYIKELKLYNFYDLLINKYSLSMSNLRDIEKNMSRKTAVIFLSSNIMMLLVSGSLSAYVIYGITNGDFTVGDFILIGTSVFAFGNMLGELFSLIPSIKTEGVYIDYLNEILLYKPIIQENKEGLVINNYDEVKISFQEVSFLYPNNLEETVLRNISLDIHNGEKIAVVGRNGSGKSTFVKLLLNLYKPTEGVINCNDHNYCDYNTKKLRSIFSIVFQDFQIYAVSVAENVLMRDANSEEDYKIMWEALKFSGLYEKVMDLKNNIHTVITNEFDDDGAFLSGGEKQKLAIARAFAAERNILVFDEPSSELDPIAEDEMFKKILLLGKNKTVIYISHRLSSVVDADRIILFDNGEIIETGTHNELMETKGLYFEMYKLQAEMYSL